MNSTSDTAENSEPKPKKISLTCPHGKKVRVEKYFGMSRFVHEVDNKGCALMNKFSTTAKLTLKHIVKNTDLESGHPIHKARIVIDASMLKEEINKWKDMSLADVLLDINRLDKFADFFGNNKVINNMVDILGYDAVRVVEAYKNNRCYDYRRRAGKKGYYEQDPPRYKFAEEADKVIEKMDTLAIERRNKRMAQIEKEQAERKKKEEAQRKEEEKKTQEVDPTKVVVHKP